MSYTLGDIGHIWYVHFVRDVAGLRNGNNYQLSRAPAIRVTGSVQPWTSQTATAFPAASGLVDADGTALPAKQTDGVTTIEGCVRV